MRYLSFEINNYRAIDRLVLPLNSKLIPMVGVNECGKTTILQAIYSFDRANDEEYGGRHLKSIHNLYDTVNYESSVTARISLSVGEVLEVLNHVEQEKLKSTATNEIPGFIYTDELVLERLGNKEKQIELEITRNLNNKAYNVKEFLPDILLGNSAVINEIALELVRRLPYILYNDDFADRPPSEIQIPPLSSTEPYTGWVAIYERLFHLTDDSYSLSSTIEEKDPRRKLSILSDVESFLNERLSIAWKSLSSEKNTGVKVSLTMLDEPQRKLQIQIIEQLDNKNRYFDVLDRSKGFVWYFNFIMKTQFNPKITGKMEDTIFLLDEPGSYLHSSAQDKLSEKLKEISENYGFVIYCTHSHHLLDPEFIPLKNIRIVEKNDEKKVNLHLIESYSSGIQKINALQPVYEALQLPIFEFFSDQSILLLVEGINDKYFLETFLSIEGIRILPGTSADSIVKNIPYMLTYNKKFICLWDNDKEGILSSKRAHKDYKIDNELLLTLPLEENSKRRMEDVLKKEDYALLRKELNLENQASYDIIIPSLFFTEKKKRLEIIQLLSQEAKNTIKIIEKIIQKAISKYQTETTTVL